MNNLLKKINFVGIFTFLGFLILTAIIYYTHSCDYFFGDVLYEGIPVSAEYFIRPVHGRYFAEILERLIGFANLAGIHPMDFVNTGLALIKALITAVIFYIIASSIYINGLKKNFLLPVFMILIYFLTFQYPCISNSPTEFFGYTTQIIFLLLGWNFVRKYFVDEKQIDSGREIFFLSVTAFFLGMASEFMNISFLFLMILLIPFSKIKTTIKTFKVPVIFFFISFIAAYLNPKFWDNVRDEKEMVMSVDFITNVFSDFKEFFLQMYNHVILEQKYLILFILAVLVLIFVIGFKNEKAKKFVLLTIFELLSVLLFFSSLIACGRNPESGNFWFIHAGLISLFRVSLIYLSAASFGFLLSCIEKPKYIPIIIQIIALIVLFKLIHIDLVEYINKVNYENALVRRDVYKLDKIATFYISKNQDAYVPFKLMENFVNNVLTTSTEDFLEDKERLLTDYQYYISLTYNKYNPIENNIYIINDDEAFEKFYSEGGSFTDEELSNLNFSKLRFGK